MTSADPEWTEDPDDRRCASDGPDSHASRPWPPLPARRRLCGASTRDDGRRSPDVRACYHHVQKTGGHRQAGAPDAAARPRTLTAVLRMDGARWLVRS
jgi:hypothetical protein